MPRRTCTSTDDIFSIAIQSANGQNTTVMDQGFDVGNRHGRNPFQLQPGDTLKTT
jgi:hypothetical protein